MTHPPPPAPWGPHPPRPDWPPPAFPAYDPYVGYGAPYGYAAFPPPARTEGLAIASLVVSCVSVGGLCTWGFACVLGILGAIFGHVARSRIRRSGGHGGGMALAGIIVGWTTAAIGLLMAAFFIALVAIDGFAA